MSKYKYEIIIFIVEAIFMTLELVAARILSPHFGNTNIVWTCIIGIILISSSLGNFIGGIIADKKEREKCLKIILTTSAIFVLLIPIVQNNFFDFLVNEVKCIKIGAIISTVTLFFIPSFILGLINPIVLKEKIKTLDNVGKTTGRIYATATLGGIFGTFLSGFYLIPNFGSTQILFVLSIILLILSTFVRFKKHNKKSIIFIIVTIIIILLLFGLYCKQNILNVNKVLKGEIDVILHLDTQYGSVSIYNTQFIDDKIRKLKVADGVESSTFISEENKYELATDYLKDYDLMFQSDIEINDVLLIGGGGYSYPKYFISHYEEKTMDVVEIDEEVTEIAKKYFFLGDLIKEYNLKENERLKIYSEDGRTYLNKNTKKYDAILNDSFSGLIPPENLTTIEAIKKIKSSLSENGLYLTNIISSLDEKNSKFLRAEVKTLNEIFKNVYVVQCFPIVPGSEIQNFMVIASDNELKLKNTRNITPTDSDIILTDDYCPIESLIPKKEEIA